MSNPLTDGPWSAKRYDHGWMIGPQPDGVCSIHDNSDGDPDGIQRRNAMLLAAAPELLAFAKSFVEQWESHGECNSDGMYDDAKAAVTKALSDE